MIFVTLLPFKEAFGSGLTKDAILADLRQQMFALRDAFAFVIEPPSVPGIGTGGGLKGYVQDRSGRGLPALEQAAWAVAGYGGADARLQPGVHAVQYAHAADLRRHRPYQGRGSWAVPISRVFDTLSIYMGSAFVTTSIFWAGPSG